MSLQSQADQGIANAVAGNQADILAPVKLSLQPAYTTEDKAELESLLKTIQSATSNNDKLNALIGSPLVIYNFLSKGLGLKI